MRVFTLGTIIKHEKSYPNAGSSLRAWHKAMKSGSFSSFRALRKYFGNHVRKTGHCYIFNIAGNDIRLIAKINIPKGFVFIKSIMTHAEYDKETWYDDCNCDESS